MRNLPKIDFGVLLLLHTLLLRIIVSKIAKNKKLLIFWNAKNVQALNT